MQGHFGGYKLSLLWKREVAYVMATRLLARRSLNRVLCTVLCVIWRRYINWHSVDDGWINEYGELAEWYWRGESVVLEERALSIRNPHSTKRWIESGRPRRQVGNWLPQPWHGQLCCDPRQGARDLSLLGNAQTGSGVLPSSCSVVTGVPAAG